MFQIQTGHPIPTVTGATIMIPSKLHMAEAMEVDLVVVAAVGLCTTRDTTLECNKLGRQFLLTANLIMGLTITGTIQLGLHNTQLGCHQLITQDNELHLPLHILPCQLIIDHNKPIMQLTAHHMVTQTMDPSVTVVYLPVILAW
jgi:hypothetical protein